LEIYCLGLMFQGSAVFGRGGGVAVDGCVTGVTFCRFLSDSMVDSEEDVELNVALCRAAYFDIVYEEVRRLRGRDGRRDSERVGGGGD